LIVFRDRSLRRTDHLSRAVLPTVVCMRVHEDSKMKPWSSLSSCAMGKNLLHWDI
jgi:hypothetical protein